MGENILIVHGGGPTSVINASLYGAVKEAKKYKEIEHIYAAKNGTGGLMREELIELENVPDEKLELLLNTPGSAIGTSRDQIEQAEYDRMIEVLLKKNIKYVLFNGGNGSMDTCGKLYKNCQARGLDIRVMGIPKTHDNDIAITDHSPGYGSIARYMAQSVKEVAADVKGLPIHVVVVEALGRNAGWLTGAAALATGEDCEGPDMLFLPEITFDVDAFMKKVAEIHKKKKSVVIAISEGVKVADGRYVCELTDNIDYVDAFGHRQLTGTARFLAEKISKEVGCKTRAIEFNSLQRCASHIVGRVDITEAYQVGGAAVKAAFEGETGKMVILKRVSDDPYLCVTDIYDVHKIANVEKKVPREWINEAGDYVTDEFLDYVRPLIQAELTPMMVDGLPRHLRLEDIAYKK